MDGVVEVLAEAGVLVVVLVVEEISAVAARAEAGRLNIASYIRSLLVSRYPERQW